jgi:hypothetical protein
MSDPVSALEEICEHAHDEEWWDGRATCGNRFHTTHFSQRGELVRDKPSWCPNCFSSWWATDGSSPSDPSYAMEAVARKALMADA